MDKTAYVTGADRGLGYALAAELLKRSYNVFAGSYMPDCENLYTLSEKISRKLTVVKLDISDTDTVNAAAEIIAGKTRHLNAIFNCAGVASMYDRDATLFDDADYGDILRTFDVNALGMLRVVKSVLGLLLNADDKRIVNITSLAASVKLLARKNQIAYTMSKAAGNMLTKQMYNALHERGVKVFAMHPGWMHTSIFGDNPDNMKGAPFEPEDSARLVLDFTLNAEQKSDHIFFNYDGTPMEY